MKKILVSLIFFSVLGISNGWAWNKYTYQEREDASKDIIAEAGFENISKVNSGFFYWPIYKQFQHEVLGLGVTSLLFIGLNYITDREDPLSIPSMDAYNLTFFASHSNVTGGEVKKIQCLQFLIHDKKVGGSIDIGFCRGEGVEGFDIMGDFYFGEARDDEKFEIVLQKDKDQEQRLRDEQRAKDRVLRDIEKAKMREIR